MATSYNSFLFCELLGGASKERRYYKGKNYRLMNYCLSRQEGTKTINYNVLEVCSLCDMYSFGKRGSEEICGRGPLKKMVCALGKVLLGFVLGSSVCEELQEKK